jgi:hypothetical protein
VAEGLPAPTITPGRTATATRPAKLPVVRLSEVLAAPLNFDWDGDGKADVTDDWIEIANTGTRPANVSGWSVDLGPGGLAYRFPRGTVLRAGEHRVLPGKTTKLALIDSGGQVRLRDARNALIDMVVYPALLPDASYSPDATGAWRADYPPSPGRPGAPFTR